MKNFIQRYQLPSFFLLAYLLSWLSVPFMQGGQTTWGVALAARIVIGATLGLQGVREHYKRVMNRRASWWFLIAPLIVIGYEGTAFALNLMLGAKLAGAPHLTMGTLAMLVLFGGQWEELGWTAYALPRLQERFADRPNGKLMAALIERVSDDLASAACALREDLLVRRRFPERCISGHRCLGLRPQRRESPCGDGDAFHIQHLGHAHGSCFCWHGSGNVPCDIHFVGDVVRPGAGCVLAIQNATGRSCSSVIIKLVVLILDAVNCSFWKVAQ